MMNALIDAVLIGTGGYALLERLLFASVELALLSGLLIIFTRWRSVPARLESVAWQILFVVALFHLCWGPVVPLSVPEQVVRNEARVKPQSEVTPFGGTRHLYTPNEVQDTGPLNSVAADPSSEATELAVTKPVQERFNWAGLLFVCWCGGSTLCGAYFLYSRLRFYALVRGSADASPAIQTEFDAACASLKPWLRPRLVMVPNAYGPAVGGILRPVVLLPQWLEEPELHRIRYWALRHELMHLIRLDNYTDLLRRIACSVFFFHPMIWWASHRWEESAELVCDQALPKKTEDATDYAKFLLEYADRADASKTYVTAGALTATRVGLGRRIRALLAWTSNEKRHMSWRLRTVVAIVAAVILLVGFQWRNDSVALAQEGDGSFVGELRRWFGDGQTFPSDSVPTPPIDNAGLSGRTLRFPDDRSLGILGLGGQVLPARGTITVQVGETTSLSVASDAVADLSPLNELGANALQSISFSGAVPDEQLAYLSHLTGLNSVDLFQGGISDAGLAHLAPLTNLTMLDLNSTFISDEGLRFLRGMQRLQHLDINRTHVSDAGMIHIAELRNLSNLDIWHTAVTDAGVEILSSLPNMQYIGLEDCLITDAGVQHFLRWPKLDAVDLENTMVTDEAIQVLSQLRRMQWLDLADTQISSEGVPGLTQLQELRNLNLPITISSHAAEPLADLPAYGSLLNRRLQIPISFEVRNRTTGKGISGAEIIYIPSEETDGHFDGNNTYHVWTDRQGRVTVYGAPGQRVAQVRVLAPGHVGLVQMFEFGEALGNADGPRLYIDLEPGSVIGGIVLTPEGQPLPGATVSIPIPGVNNIDGAEELPYSMQTDENGVWSCDVAPTDLSACWISVVHPEFSGVMYDPEQLDAVALRLGSEQLAVLPPQSFKGFVVDTNGRPIENAFVVEVQPWRRRGFNATENQATTDRNGAFVLRAADLGQRPLNVVAAGYSPLHHVMVDVTSGMEPPKLILSPY